MRYCGIDVSAKPGNQQLCTLHERRGPTAWSSSRPSTSPGTVEQVARTVHGFGRGQAVVAVDAPSGHRLDLLAAGAPLRRELGLPEGRYERMRVCDALLFRRGLPLYPGPVGRPAAQRLDRVDARSASSCSPRSAARAVPAARGRVRGRVGESALASGRLCETYPGRDLLRAARPPAGRQAHAVGPAGADRGAQAQGDRRRGRRPVAAHARRARRLRRRLRRLRAGRRARELGRRTPTRAWSCSRRSSCATAMTSSPRRPASRWRSLPPHGIAENRCAFAARLPARRGPGRIAAPGFLGRGHDPGVAVDAAGTAHVAWLTEAGDAGALEYCQVPRGKRACALRRSIPLSEDGFGKVQVLLPRPGDRPDRRAAAAAGGARELLRRRQHVRRRDDRGGHARDRAGDLRAGRVHLADVGLRPGVVRPLQPPAGRPADFPVEFGSATESLRPRSRRGARGFVPFFSGLRARSALWNGLGDPTGPRLGRGPAARQGRASRRRRRSGRGSPTCRRRGSPACAACAPAAASAPSGEDARRPVQGSPSPRARVATWRSCTDLVVRVDRALAQRAPLDAAEAAVPRQRPAGPAGRARPPRRLDVWDSNPGNAGMPPIRIAALPRAPRRSAIQDRAYNRGRGCSAPQSPNPEGRAKQRAYAIAAIPEGDDLSELRELLRTAGVAVVGGSSSTASSPTRTPTSGRARSRRSSCSSARTRTSSSPTTSSRRARSATSRGARRAGARPHRRDPRHLRRARPHRRGQAAGRARAARVQHGPHARPVDHLERLGAGRGVAASAPGARASRRSRRTAGWRATASRRSSAASTTSAPRARCSAPSASARTCRAWRSPATRTPGKSTLLNALTGSEVGVRDRLFHTLDPTTRTLQLQGRTFLMTDTVGFIRKLPHQLVDAFAATLEETALADLVLHVVDASEPEEALVAMTRAVEDVLEEIHAADSPRVLVLNKADAIDAERRAELALPPPGRRARERRDRRGPRRPARADRRRVRAHPDRRRAARALLRGRPLVRPPRHRRRPLPHRHRRGRPRHRAPAHRCSPSATTATRSTATAPLTAAGGSRTPPRRGRRGSAAPPDRARPGRASAAGTSSSWAIRSPAAPS